MPPDRSEAFAYCEALVRGADKDRYLASLFAPAERRAYLFALYAYAEELARIRDKVREPFAGQIRLQWWIDALQGEGHGAVEAHPVAAALIETVRRAGVPVALLVEMAEAHFFDLGDEQPESLSVLTHYARRIDGHLIAAAMRALGAPPPLPPAIAAAAEDLGLALKLTELARHFPADAARGKLYLPRDLMRREGADPRDALAGHDTAALRGALSALRREARRHLEAARAGLMALPRTLWPAVLPAAPVRLWLDRLDRAEARDRSPFLAADIAPWRRPFAIWRAAGDPLRMLG